MAKVLVEDLSGTSTPVTENPYDGLILTCGDSSRSIQDRYSLHRVSRNAQQKEKVLSADFSGWILDDHLLKLAGPQKDSSFVDPRNCLIFWARPPRKVKRLVEIIQQKLQDAIPAIWLMPIENLHMSLMEIAFARTAEEIEALVSALRSVSEAIADYPRTHRARVIKPFVSFDAAAIALSFVPAAGESVSQGRRASDDAYTYHHLRRDVYAKIKDAGVKIDSRYVVPSAHLTIARFNTPNPFEGDPLDSALGKAAPQRVRFIKEIEMLNQWLNEGYWPKNEEKSITPGGEWVIGEEKGLDFRKGTLWYGGGETVHLGKGF